MAAQKGAELLIKLGDGASPEAFNTIGGLRSSEITLNDEAVDVTNKDSSGVRVLLPNGGIHSMTVSGSGVFTDATSEQTLRTKMNATSFSNFKIEIPDLGAYTGAFMVESLSYAGEYNGEVTYSVTLQSSGSITFA
jgi:TP901-1 family phage major tail protein